MLEKMQEIVEKIKQEKPLILNITNYVTMDFVANGLLSMGASPIMCKAEQEVEDLLKIAKSVVINLGTLDESFIHLCHHTCGIANQVKKPIILDPVGAGASRYRTNTALKILNDYQISIVRGNASEIMALSGLTSMTKGVDSTVDSDNAMEAAKLLSKKYDVAVTVSGKWDVIADGDRLSLCDRGSSLMPMVTGTGCLLSSIVGAFHSVENNRFDAAVAAIIFYGISGEMAAEKSAGPGTFKSEFLDALNSSYHQTYYEQN
jgi:hydroxyethylthiazole kinase